VEGGPDQNGAYYVMGDNNIDSGNKVPLTKLESVSHALSPENIELKTMGKDSLIKVVYPRSASKLLQNDVVLVDR
jgi:hypothetical protein